VNLVRKYPTNETTRHQNYEQPDLAWFKKAERPVATRRKQRVDDEDDDQEGKRLEVFLIGDILVPQAT
jgi:hypothetical protein